MTNKIDQLRTEVDDIKKGLDELKNNVKLSEDEKKNRAEELKTRAETTKQKIQTEIDSLKDKTDDESKKQKEEAEALLNSFNETMTLYTSILSSTEPKSNPKTLEDKKEDDNEEKGFFGKVGDWLGEQWDNVTSGEKRKEEPGKNILRAAGVGLTGYAIYKGVKSLWNRAFGDDEEEGEDEEEERKSKKKKKKSFWKTGVGKFLKWTGIGAAGIFGINKLGKRLGRWGNEGATGRDSDKEKYESYDEFAKKTENKEKFENYEGLGDKVDNVYHEIYGRELQSGYEDELEMNKISQEQSKGTQFYKGIVPYCLDNQFKNVESILGQNSSFKTALNDGLDGMVNFVKNAGTGFLQLFVDNYMRFLPSWGIFDKATGSLSDKLEKWRVENRNAEKEMQYFFRQSIRVQTYLFQKKDQLTRKVVKEAAQKYGKSEDEIWNDKDLFDKYVVKDPQYQNFLNSPIHLAVSVLAQNNLFDSHIDEDLKKRVAEIDEDRNKILGCKNGEKDIIEIINEKKQNKEILDTNDDKKLGEACEGMLNSMDSIIEAAEDSAWNIYGDLFRNGDANLREYLEKSGLDKMFESYKQIILSKQQELKDGKLSNEDKIALAESINAMLALKKEAELGQVTVERDYDEYGNIIRRIPGFLTGSVKNLIKGVEKLIHGNWGEGLSYTCSSVLGGGIIITATGAIYRLKTGKSGLLKTGALITTLPVSLPGVILYKGASYIKPLRDFGHKINPLKYRGKKGAETLLQDLVDGRVSLDRAGNTIKRRCFPTIGSGETEKVWKKVFNVTEDMKEGFDMRKSAFDSIVKKQVNEYYLSDIKKDSQLYDELVKNWDINPEISKAVKAQKPIDELKRISKLSSAGGAAEIVTDAKKAFEASIDRAIGKLEAVANKRAYQPTIEKLKALKSDTSLAEDEMKAFSKFIDEGFHPKFIPELKKLFSIENVIEGSSEKLGVTLKKYISEGEFTKFKTLLKDSKYEKIFRDAGLDDVLRRELINNFDSVFSKFGNLLETGTKKAIQCIMRVISKII